MAVKLSDQHRAVKI